MGHPFTASFRGREFYDSQSFADFLNEVLCCLASGASGASSDTDTTISYGPATVADGTVTIPSTITNEIDGSTSPGASITFDLPPDTTLTDAQVCAAVNQCITAGTINLVSGDADNTAVLGSDNLVYVPAPTDSGGFTLTATPDNAAGTLTIAGTHTQSDGTPQAFSQVINMCDLIASCLPGSPTDDGGFTFTATPDNAAGTVTVSGVHTQSDGTPNAFSQIIDVCALLSGCPVDRVAPDGAIAQERFDASCYAYFAWQRYTDYSGNNLDATSCATVGLPQRALGFNPHDQSPHVGDWHVHALDSARTDTDEVTTYHWSSVLSAFLSRAQGAFSVVLGSIRSLASGARSIVGGSQDSTASGANSAVFGSNLGVAGGFKSMASAVSNGAAEGANTHVTASSAVFVRAAASNSWIGASNLNAEIPSGGLQFSLGSSAGVIDGGSKNGVIATNGCVLDNGQFNQTYISSGTGIVGAANDYSSGIATNTCAMNAIFHEIVSSRTVQTDANDNWSHVQGFAGVGGPATVNKTIRLESQTGNIIGEGVVASGVVSGYAHVHPNLAEGEIPMGSLVVMDANDKGHGVRLYDPKSDADRTDVMVVRPAQGCAVLAGESVFVPHDIQRWQTDEFGKPLTEMQTLTREEVVETPLTPEETEAALEAAGAPTKTGLAAWLEKAKSLLGQAPSEGEKLRKAVEGGLQLSRYDTITIEHEHEVRLETQEFIAFREKNPEWEEVRKSSIRELYSVCERSGEAVVATDAKPGTRLAANILVLKPYGEGTMLVDVS